MMAMALAGCQVSEFAYDAPHLAPIPASLERKIERMDMKSTSPILVRIYKEESELEVWKETRSGRFELLKEYEICAWSGKLGPKLKEGDRQAPEGFYTVTPGQMNPKSSYHLAFNIGFPNTYDRSHGRTGSHLMVHGDCSSRGCYAMEDEQIQEIYALAREAFRGGQRAFQVQAFPFRMTPENMARHADNENLAFWEMLKEGSDHFEVTGRVPKVDVCGRRYVFNATSSGGFSSRADCPAYDVPDDVEQLVAARRESDLQKRQTQIARAMAREDREERWAEREAAIASFFDRSRSGDDTIEAVATDESAGTVMASAPAAATVDGIPVPRPSPVAKSSAGGRGDDNGGFRIPNPFSRFTSPVASTSGVSDEPESEPLAPAPAAAPAAETPPPGVTPAATPEPAPQIAAREAVEPTTTVTEPLAYAPAEAEDDGFLSGVAKRSRGLFRRAGAIFN